MSLRLPVFLPSIEYPNVSAESSITNILLDLAIFLIFFQLGIFPIKLGTNIAFVFFVIAFSIFDTSILSVFISISTIFGINPNCNIGEIVVEKVNEGVMISDFSGKFKDACRAIAGALNSNTMTVVADEANGIYLHYNGGEFSGVVTVDNVVA